MLVIIEGEERFGNKWIIGSWLKKVVGAGGFEPPTGRI